METYEKIRAPLETTPVAAIEPKKVEAAEKVVQIFNEIPIQRRKKSSIQLSLEPKKALFPSILDPQTPEQHKVNYLTNSKKILNVILGS